MSPFRRDALAALLGARYAALVALRSDEVGATDAAKEAAVAAEAAREAAREAAKEQAATEAVAAEQAAARKAVEEAPCGYAGFSFAPAPSTAADEAAPPILTSPMPPASSFDDPRLMPGLSGPDTEPRFEEIDT